MLGSSSRTKSILSQARHHLNVFGGMSVMTAVRIISNVLILRIVGANAGNEGVATYGQSHAFATMLNGLASCSTNEGVIKNVAKSKNNDLEIEQISAQAIRISCATLILCLLAILIYQEILTKWLAISGVDSKFYLISTLTALLFTFGQVVISTYAGRKKYGRLIAVNITGFVVGAFVVLPAYVFSFVKLIWLPHLFFSVFSLIQILSAPRSIFMIASRIISLDGAYLRSLLTFSYMGLLSFILSPLALITIRGWLMASDPSEAGDWEASRRVVELVSTLLTTFFSLIAIPALSRLAKVPHRYWRYVTGLAVVSFLGTIMILISLYWMRDFFMPFVYSKNLSYSSDLFLSRIYGESFKAIVWSLGISIMILEKVKIYTLLSGASACLLLCTSDLLFDTSGAHGLNIAFSITQLIMIFLSGFAIYFVRRQCQVRKEESVGQ